MPRRLDEGALLNAVTVWYVREMLAPDHQSPSGYFKDHPLMLPAHEQSPAIIDFSVLSVPLPLRMGSRPRTEVEEMLWPLAQLCGQHKGRVPAGQWSYEWYYLELLDRDGELQPLCWVSSELFMSYLEDPRQRLQTGEDLFGGPRYFPLIAEMDRIAHSPTESPLVKARRDEWKQWLVETWLQHREQWVEEGLVDETPVRPWTQMLEFVPDLATEQQRTDLEWGGPPPEPLRQIRAPAGHPGLYWRMVPLYDQRQIWRVWAAMKRDLYVTSVFNPAARQRQDPKLWRRLEERFALPFQRMTRYRYCVRLREQRVLEWTRQGKSLSQIAELAVTSGLHPLDPERREPVDVSDPTVRDMYLASARRVAVRIRRRLREDGLIERGKPGRPRKSA